MSQPIKSIKGLEEKFRQAKSGVSDDTVFSANGVMFLAYKMESIEKLLIESVHKPKRHPSEFNVFFGEKMKAGFSPKEVGKMWREGMRK